MGNSAGVEEQPKSVHSAPATRTASRNSAFQEVSMTPRESVNSAPKKTVTTNATSRSSGGGSGGGGTSRNKTTGDNKKGVRIAEPSSSSKAQASPSKSISGRSSRVSNASAADKDIHALISQKMVREKTVLQKKSDQPQYGPDELVMETFYHQSGTTYTCIYQGGSRFYMDSWQTQDWTPFPDEWLNQGILVTEKVVDKADQENPEANNGIPVAANQTTDDREGFLDHPTKGRLQTYMYEERRNVHYYFDKDSGLWIRIPLAWELKHELVKTLMEPLQEAVPDWKDKFDMLAALRASNYDPHDTIATYMCHQDNESMATVRNPEDAKLLSDRDNHIHQLDDDVKKMKKELHEAKKSVEDERSEKKVLQKELIELRERISDVESDYSAATAQLESMKRERPKTAKREPEKPKLDPAMAKALHQNVKSLHKDHSQLKMTSHQSFNELRGMYQRISVEVSKISLFNKDNSRELNDIRELYRREALQRKLLYNKLQELRGNIRVFARCRKDDRVKTCLRFPDSETVLAPGNSKPFKFDKVFTPDSTQDEVFADTEPIITSCVDGYNVTIMAYGQTGSGKTHTMQGPKGDPGVNARSLSELLKICAERDNIDYTLKGSMVEIYNENIVDLLTPTATALDLKAQGNKIVLPGITEMMVDNLADIDNIIVLGQKNRSVASTKMNSTSSRSHLLFMIKVEGIDKKSKQVTTGTLTLVDLAGSERVGKTEATGQRLVEAAAINKSLSSLGQVFTALRTGQLHVPYRNSKLTHLLQPSLGGDAKACLFVALSPDENNSSESVSSMQFGSNARQVALGQAKKNIRGPPGMDD